LEDPRRDDAGGCRVQGDVEESGSRGLGMRDALERVQLLRERLGELSGIAPQALAESESHVGGPVAVLAAAGPLQSDVRFENLRRALPATRRAASRTTTTSSAGFTRVDPSRGGLPAVRAPRRASLRPRATPPRT